MIHNIITDENYYDVEPHTSGTVICYSYLDELNCGFRAIRELHCPNTRVVRCHNNFISEITVTNTEKLFCGNNKLTKLLAPNAKMVYASGNQLVDLYCPEAEVVNVGFNNLTYLNLPNAISINIIGNPNLKEINAPKLKKMVCDKNFDVLINLDLEDVSIVCGDYNEINYNEWVDHLISKRRFTSTKSARAIK